MVKVLRVIVPKFPEPNVFTGYANRTTDFGSAMLATVADKSEGWHVEAVNENNWRGPKDAAGLPDHVALQEDAKADAVALCCGLSCTMIRAWDLMSFYKQQGSIILAGGWHAHYCPEETLRHGAELVVHGDGEPVIQKILVNIQEGAPLYWNTPGVSYLAGGLVVGGRICHNNQLGTRIEQIPDMDRSLVALRNEVKDLDSLPYPNFGLYKCAKIKIYPVSRVRGCSKGCEFCSVKGKPAWASPEWLFGMINWLVQTRRAKDFFLVDDRSEEDLPGTIRFWQMIAKKYGRRLNFTVQIRLEAAANTEFVLAMHAAGVRAVCIGFESPIDEDLRAMQKGLSASKMLEWTKILRRYFWIHGMFIFGYPPKTGKSFLSPDEAACRYKSFIKKAKLQSVQVTKAIPLVGTALRRRLDSIHSIFPLDLADWSLYGGDVMLYKTPDMSMDDFQKTQELPIHIMGWFYSRLSFIPLCLRTLAFPFDYLIRGWRGWHKGWLQNAVKFGGSKIVKAWWRKENARKIFLRLQNFCIARDSQQQ